MNAHPIEDGFISTEVGRIHYLHAGTGRALVLLHSNGGSAYEFGHVISALAQNFHVFAWDMPGHGDSDPLTHHGSVEFYANSLISFLDALGLDKAVCLGSSIGGAIVAETTARYESRIERAVIVETLIRSAVDWRKGWNRIEGMFAVTVQSFDEVAPRFRALTPDTLARWNIDRSKAGSKTMIDVMWALRDHDIEKPLSRISVPTQIIFGDKGPAHAYRDVYSLVIPSARQVILKDCGHFPMVDNPQAFVEAVFDFCGYQSA